jgi:4-hydroxybenzoate polyprenyltransferase
MVTLFKLRKFFDKIESDNSSLLYWLLAFVAIIFVRNFLEEALESSHNIISLQYFFVEYTLWYVLLFLSLLILLRLITKEKSINIAKVLTVFFILILIVPVIDFFASSGAGYQMRYLRGDTTHLLNNFITAYSDVGTIGQRIEGVLFEVLLFAYIFVKTRSYLKSIMGILAAYVILLFCAALPSLIYLLSNLFFESPLSTSVFAPGGAFIQKIFESYISQYIVILVIALLIILELPLILFISDRRKFKFVKGLVRPLRLLHYEFLALFGLLLGFSLTGGLQFELYNFLLPLAFLVSTALIYQFACVVNDIFDKDLYARLKISKSEENSKDLGYIAVALLILSLLATYAVGPELFILLATFASLAYLYSAPPLRLKKYPVVASLVLAICSLIIVLGGFAVFAQDKSIEMFPSQIALMILVVYTLGTNYKDLKDIKLDKENKIYTIPVLFGEKRGGVIVSLMTASAFILTPMILNIPALMFPSLVAVFLSIWFIKKNLDERYFRIMHLIYFSTVLYFIFT